MTLDDMAANAALLWLAAAVVLGIAELVVPGVFLIFLAIAAAVTGVASYVLADLPVAAQLGSFAAWSIATVLIGRRWYTDYPLDTTDAKLNDRAARLVGEIVTVETAIEHGRGRVRVGDGAWPARGPEMAAGVQARVVAVDDGVVVVVPEGQGDGALR